MVVTWIVRLAALVSLIGFIFQWPDKGMSLRIMEVIMIAIWAQMEYSAYKIKRNE